MMNLTYRQCTPEDLNGLKALGLKCWQQFRYQLTEDNWTQLHKTLTDAKTYTTLLEQSHSIVCLHNNNKIIGMAFLAPSGNPTDIYEETWSYIRLVSVDPEFEGKGIGRELTRMCIETAKQNGEHTIALHTSEMMSRARHIYESMGFVISKEIAPRLGKRYWLYLLDLTLTGSY